MSAGPNPGVPEPPAARTLRAAGEVVLLILVATSPWPLGSEQPRWEFALAAGVLAPWGITLPPAVGALLMSASTIVVALNAQLLRGLDLRPGAP